MTIIIAEAGVNHNGDIALAKKMVNVAKEAGADFVKFQTFTADATITQNAEKAEYQIASTGNAQSQYEMVKDLELTFEDHVDLIEHCKNQGIKFLSTAFDIQSLKQLIELGCLDYIKLPSGEITNLPLIREMAKCDLPILMSTGMADLNEIEEAIVALEGAGVNRKKITVLHCTTEYPAPMKEINLKAMGQIQKLFGCEVGYSDHSLGIEVAIAAVAKGACVIEKHFTLSRNLQGPDHSASLEPQELKSMISAIRNIEFALGNGEKKPTNSELKNRIIARKSIVAARKIKRGEVFSEKNLAVKRPGKGISPMMWDNVVGQIAKQDFDFDDLIKL